MDIKGRGIYLVDTEIVTVKVAMRVKATVLGKALDIPLR